MSVLPRVVIARRQRSPAPSCSFDRGPIVNEVDPDGPFHPSCREAAGFAVGHGVAPFVALVARLGARMAMVLHAWRWSWLWTSVMDGAPPRSGHRPPANH